MKTQIIILTIILLSIILPNKALSSADILALWVSDIPMDYSHECYKLIRNILSSSHISYSSVNPWYIGIIKGEIGLTRWLKTWGYNLVIITCARSYYKNVVIDLIKLCLDIGIPILFIPGYTTDIGLSLGLGMRKTLFTKINTSVIEHKVTNGTYIIGVYNYSIIGIFYPAGTKGENWTPIAMIGDGAIVAVAEFDKMRAAAIAPYLYTEDVYDNKRLIKNIIYWLLYKTVPETELGEWPPINETEYKIKTLKEIEKLKEEKDKLNITLIELQTRIKDLNTTLLRLHQLEEEVQQLKGQLSNKSIEIQIMRDEIEKMNSEVRYVYKLLGTAIAVSFIIGFVASHILTKKYLKKKSG